MNDQLNKVLEYVKGFPRVKLVWKLVSPFFDGCGGKAKGQGTIFLPTLEVGVRKPVSPGDSPNFSPRIIMSRCALLA